LAYFVSFSNREILITDQITKIKQINLQKFYNRRNFLLTENNALKVDVLEDVCEI